MILVFGCWWWFCWSQRTFLQGFFFHRNVTTWWQLVTKERSQMSHVVLTSFDRLPSEIFWTSAGNGIQAWHDGLNTWWMVVAMALRSRSCLPSDVFSSLQFVIESFTWMNINEHEDPDKHIRIACFVIWSTSYLQHSFLEDLGGIECWNFWRTVCFNDVVPRVFLPFAFQAIKNWRAFWPPSLPTQSVPCPWLSRLGAMNH